MILKLIQNSIVNKVINKKMLITLLFYICLLADYVFLK